MAGESEWFTPQILSTIVAGLIIGVGMSVKYFMERWKPTQKNGSDNALRAQILGMGIGETTGLAMIADRIRELNDSPDARNRHNEMMRALDHIAEELKEIRHGIDLRDARNEVRR